MRRALASIAICAWTATASAGPPLSARWQLGEDISAGRRVIQRRAEIALELDLQPGAWARVVDSGRSSESSGAFEETTWRNTWSVRWIRRGPRLTLKLGLDDRRCNRTRVEPGLGQKKLACLPVSPQVQMECRTEQITVQDPSGSTAQHEAWRCAPAAVVDLAGTPSPWVIGKATCLEAFSDVVPGGLSYRVCKP